MSKTSEAFDIFRSQYNAKPLDHALVRNDGELVLISENDGREPWGDGPGVPEDRPEPPEIEQSDPNLTLWVINVEDVPIALESGAFGIGLETGKLKHSNLTGGKAAHCGGELFQVAPDVVAINASSGRYGARSQRELAAVAAALRAMECGATAGTREPIGR